MTNLEIVREMMRHYGVTGPATPENILTAYRALINERPTQENTERSRRWLAATRQHWEARISERPRKATD